MTESRMGGAVSGIDREALLDYLDELLMPGAMRDYCPNGLQVEGRPVIHRLLTGVTACQALLDAAVTRGADAVLVHHGYFWRGEDSRVIGVRRRRLATLLINEINLVGYHLPLDVHPTIGNNAQLASACGWTASGRFGEQDIGWLGKLADGAATVGEVATKIAAVTRRTPLVLGKAAAPVRRLAWCSGGGQGYFEAAIALGVDLYVSGEASEQTTHLARESGVAFIAAGHHATERFGIQALGNHLAERFAIDVEFVDIENPI